MYMYMYSSQGWASRCPLCIFMCACLYGMVGTEGWVGMDCLSFSLLFLFHFTTSVLYTCTFMYLCSGLDRRGGTFSAIDTIFMPLLLHIELVSSLAILLLALI